MSYRANCAFCNPNKDHNQKIVFKMEMPLVIVRIGLEIVEVKKKPKANEGTFSY